MAHSERWKVLVKEFPCLYHTKNPDFLNKELKARCFEQLLQRCNNEGDQMDMETLKQRVSGLQLVTTWRNIMPNARESRRQKPIQMPHKNANLMSIGSNNTTTDRFMEMAREFPCLWDHRDLNYRNGSAKRHCYKQLLEKYNRESSVPMTMEHLMKTLRNTTSRMKYQLKNADRIGTNNTKTDRFMEMAREFPCLWDSRDLNFRVESAKKHCYKQLLEKYNRESSVPMTMECLRKTLRNVTRRMKYQLETAGGFGDKKLKTDPLFELAQEFPYLWDSEDLNFRDEKLKNRGYQQLLEKYNKESALQITDVTYLKRKLYNLRNRLKLRQMSRQKIGTNNTKTDRFMEMAREFPCLWDSRDLNFRVESAKKHCYKQLLEKYNRESSVPMTMECLRKALRNVTRRMKYQLEAAGGERSSGKDEATRWNGEDCGPETGESSSRPQQQTSDDLPTENSSDAEPLVNLRQDSAPPVVLQGFEIVFNWCCFCGEVRNDCDQVTHDKPYVTAKKIILTMNDINVEVDFRKDTTPQTICRSCDRKLQEMYEFVKLVKKTRDKFSIVCNIDDLRDTPGMSNESPSYMSTSDGEDDKGHVIYDSLSISDTEFTNKSVSARKRKNNKEEVAASRKKFRVSIDLNSMSSFCDDSNGSNYMNLNCDEGTDASVDASEETTIEVNTVNESVTIKKEIIESPEDAGKAELFDTENALQCTEKLQNTSTSSSETRNKLAGETNSVIDQDTAIESISVVTFADNSLNIATEAVKPPVVREDYELTHDYDKDIQHHTIRTRIRPSEAQKRDASEINSQILLTNNDSPKAITADDGKKVSENAETVIKQECILLSDSDDEDNSDVQPNTKTKLEPTAVQDTQVLVSDASKLLGTQMELLNGTTGPTASVTVNQRVCVIPKIDLVSLVESIVGRMLNK